jgi:predicted transglutaminase-like cysteine proteinase
MNIYTRRILCTLLAALWTATACVTGARADGRGFIAIGGAARPPIGWTEFCAEQQVECAPGSSVPRDAILSGQNWRELVRINRLVNESVRPMTDLEQHGVAERWSYPVEGYGDCEDYVLLKRRLLIDAGWPRQSLLITVVREHNGDGHAVLTVKTDRGEFVLDNQNVEVVPWSQSGYRFVKRQSQSDPNQWVSLGDSRPAAVTATSR